MPVRYVIGEDPLRFGNFEILYFDFDLQTAFAVFTGTLDRESARQAFVRARQRFPQLTTFYVNHTGVFRNQRGYPAFNPFFGSTNPSETSPEQYYCRIEREIRCNESR
jgi:hypothetical protein